MCCITGQFDTRGKADIDRGVLQRMKELQLHRGPEEGSLHVEPSAGFGHRRLSIIDIATGRQPLFNEDGSAVVIFNGEIYDYQSLIPELQATGHVFHTKRDTECIVRAWEQWGETCVERFRGKFAFALRDPNKQTLFMARDRLGLKPMYYAVLDDGLLLSGSELKSLMAHPGLKRDIEPLAIEEYFAQGYMAEPRTIFRQALKLPPGHTLSIRRGEPVGQLREYWDVHFTLGNPTGAEDACEELRHWLLESVKLRRIAEVQQGTYLSGGVDSSAVVQATAGLSQGPVNTCSIAINDPAYNERLFAQIVADRYRTNQRLETVDSDDFEIIDTVAHLYDEPSANSSAIPAYRVCQLARKHVTVALSDGDCDETIGFYRRYRLHMMDERLRVALPQGVRKPIFGLQGRLYSKADWAPRVLRAKTTFAGMARGSLRANFHNMSFLREPLRNSLYSSSLKAQPGGYGALDVFRRHARMAGTNDPLALIQYIDTPTHLVGDINTKVDRASMAHSLEVREPLMDHELVEWVATRPSALKRKGDNRKSMLKNAMEPASPDDVLYPPKMGFAVPLVRWFRRPLRGRVRDSLLEGLVQDSGLFNPTVMQRLVREHQGGQHDHSTPLGTLLMFDASLRIQVGASRQSKPSRLGLAA